MADSKVEYESEKQQYESTVIQTTTEVITRKEEFDEKGERIYVVTEAEKKLVRKLDFIYVMPIVAILNFLQASNCAIRPSSFSVSKGLTNGFVY